MMHVGGYHEYRGGCPVPWGEGGAIFCYLSILQESQCNYPKEANRSKQDNLSFSYIITCLLTNSVMAVLGDRSRERMCHTSYPHPSIQDIQ